MSRNRGAGRAERRGSLRPWPGALLLLLLVLAGAGPALGHEEGTWPVASTCLELDPNLVKPGFSLSNHLIGSSLGEEYVYLDTILAHPGETFRLELQVPEDGSLYGQLAGKEIPVVGFFLHPTSTANDRPDYRIPGYEAVFPRMAGPGREPLWPSEPGPWPLLVYSHGLNFFPGELDELDYMARLASRGYVILALFHGDGRFPPDLATEKPLQLALRVQTLKQTLDFLEKDPYWAPLIDWSRIGGVGVSYGGSSILAWSGAGVMTDLDQGRAEPILADPRVKASVGVVTFSGLSFLPLFGWEMEGGESLIAPQLIICSDGDIIAPCEFSRLMLARSPQPGYLVTLLGQDHFVAEAIQKDAEDWTAIFLEAYIKEDREALHLLHSQTSNPGGGDDLMEIINPPDLSLTGPGS